jgi:hypothetical protein
MARRATARALIATVTPAAGGAVLGWLTLRPFGVRAASVGASVAGLNGALSGHRRIYPWRRPAGLAAFLLDSTWGLAGTATALVAHAAQAVAFAGGGYRADLSVGESRHVYERGLHLKRGFALTWGNVVTNAGGRRGLDPSTAEGARRRAFVRDHEGLHVWQHRWFGPLFPVLYGAWLAGGAVVGTAVWLRHRDQSWYSLVETAAYYDNPFEWWAYRNDGHWPPAGAHPMLAWGGRRA